MAYEKIVKYFNLSNDDYEKFKKMVYMSIKYGTYDY